MLYQVTHKEYVMESLIIQEFKYFLEHQAEFLEQYEGKYIVIKDRTVIGEYNDELTAVTETSKKHEVGTFLVQKVTRGDTAYTQTFHSRVIFA